MRTDMKLSPGKKVLFKNGCIVATSEEDAFNRVKWRALSAQSGWAVRRAVGVKSSTEVNEES